MQHPQIRLCITFELLEGLFDFLLSGRKALFCPLSEAFFAEYPCLWWYPYPVICMDRRDEGTILWWTVHHFLEKRDAPFSVIGVPDILIVHPLQFAVRPSQPRR